MLATRYPLEGGWSKYIFPVLGSILVGIGIILFFASNWQQMPVWSKLFLIFGALLASQYAGYRFRYESDQPWLGSGFLVLAGIVFGAAIFLIAQVYNINAYFPNGILFWALGVMLMAAITLERPLMILGSLLLLLWAGTDWGNSGQVTYWVGLAAVFLVSFPLAYKIRDKVVLFLTLALMLLVIAGGQGEDIVHLTGLTTMILVGSAIFVRGRDRDELFGEIYSLLGLMVVMLVLYVLSFRDYYGLDLLRIEFSGYALLGASFLAFWAYRIKTTGQYARLRREIQATFLLNLGLFGLLAISPQFSDVGLIMAVVINIVLFFMIVAAIWHGSKIQNRPMVNLGLVFFYLLVLSRYFDFAFQYMERSLFFIIGGVLLIGLGIILNRQQKKIVGSWGEHHE